METNEILLYALRVQFPEYYQIQEVSEDQSNKENRTQNQDEDNSSCGWEVNTLDKKK